MGRPRVRILIAPDSFKGTYTAAEVADAIAAGAESAGHEAVRMPVADGGEGTLDVLTDPLGLERIDVDAVNPWRVPCPGFFGLSPDGTAIVELATVSGITTAHNGVRDAATADTYGTDDHGRRGETWCPTDRRGRGRVGHHRRWSRSDRSDRRRRRPGLRVGRRAHRCHHPLHRRRAGVRTAEGRRPRDRRTADDATARSCSVVAS